MNVQQENISGLIFSAELQRLMEKRDLTQEQVAAVGGVTQGAVSGWLKGSIPKGDALYRVAKYFGTSMETLLTGKVLAANEAVKSEVRLSGVTEKTLRLAAHAAETLIELQDELKKLS